MRNLTKLLLFSFVLLLFSSVNFTDSQESLLLTTRVLPIFLCFIITSYINIRLGGFLSKYPFRAIKTPFFKFYLLFIIVNSISGIVNGISVGWLLWKNFEILTGMLWFISFHSLYSYMKLREIINRISILTFIFFISLCTYELFFLLKTNNFLNLLLVIRPELDFPKINPIKLSIFASYITIYSLLKFKRTNYIWLFLSFFGILMIVIAKSRTGFLILLLFFLYEQFIFSKQIALRALFVSFIFTVIFIFLNKHVVEFLSIMRIDDWETFLKGGGRIKLMDKTATTSSWGESVSMIKKNVLIGIGNINTNRFLDTKLYSVDNFILQNFIASGFIGGFLLSFWAFFKFPVNFWNYFKKSKKKYNNFEVRFANLTLITFFIKSFTTNGASFFGVSFLFLGIAFTIFDNIKN